MSTPKKNRIQLAGYDKSEEFKGKTAIQSNRGNNIIMLDERPELIAHIDDWLKDRIAHRSMSGSKRVCDILAELYPDLWTPTKGALIKWLELNRKKDWGKVQRMKSV
jgi:hypothetical protein